MRGNALPDQLAGLSHGIVTQMGVTLSRGGQGMSEQFPEDHEADACTRTHACMAVSEIVESNILESSASPDLHWDAKPFLDAHDLSRAEKIVSFFDDLLFEGTLTAAEEALFTEFITTDDAYAPRPLEREQADFESRVRRALGMMLSLPQWQFQ